MKGTKVEKGTPVTKGTPVEIAEGLSARQWAALRWNAQEQALKTIGEAVLRVLRSKEALGLETLLASLRALVADSPSMKGRLSPEHDMARVTAESAITRLLEAAGGVSK